MARDEHPKRKELDNRDHDVNGRGDDTPGLQVARRFKGTADVQWSLREMVVGKASEE